MRNRVNEYPKVANIQNFSLVVVGGGGGLKIKCPSKMGGKIGKFPTLSKLFIKVPSKILRNNEQ